MTVTEFVKTFPTQRDVCTVGYVSVVHFHIAPTTMDEPSRPHDYLAARPAREESGGAKALNEPHGYRRWEW